MLTVSGVVQSGAVSVASAALVGFFLLLKILGLTPIQSALLKVGHTI